MKKLALALFLFSSPLLAQISATTQWDVRTGGSDSNGGCFDPGVVSPGTDFSQQNSAQVAFSDLVIGATNTQLTSAGNPFSSASVGNCINITGGTNFTTGRYEIISVSGITATMDRAVGTAASTGGTGNLGGSLLIPATGMNGATGGNTVWVKSGTYTQTSSPTINGANLGTTVPLTVEGYGTTHGDNGTAPLLTTSTNSVNIFNFSAPTFYVLVNLSLSSTATSPGNGVQQNNGGPAIFMTTMRCTLSGFNNAFNSDNVGAHGIWKLLSISGTEIVGSKGVAIANNNNTTTIIGSYIHGGSSDGISGSGGFVEILGTIISANSGFGLNYPAIELTVQNSDFVGNTSGGITGSSASTYWNLQNNIFYGNGGFGVSAASGNVVNINVNNAYGNNTSGATNNVSTGLGAITLTASPFTSSTNFALNATAGGGVLLTGLGAPSAFGTTTVNALSVGAVQSAGGGGTTVVGNYGTSN